MLLRRAAKHAKPPKPTDGTLHVPPAGTVVSVELSDADRVWRSRVEEQQGRRLAVVAPLDAAGEPVRPGRRVTVTLAWPSKLGHLEAIAEVVGLEEGDAPLWRLDVRTSELSQRRSAFRLDVQQPLALVVLEGDLAAAGELEATTRNLSEGGFACELHSKLDLDADLPVAVTLRLPVGTISGNGRVVRAVDTISGGVEIGVAFEGLDEYEAERLRQWVFEEQLNRRAAGLR
jgi:hypothetical protein